MPIYMNIPNLPGDSSTAGYLGWHVLSYFYWNCSTPPGGLVSFSEFVVYLSPGSSSTKLMAAVAAAKPFDRIIVAVSDNAGMEQERYTLGNAVISSLYQGFSSSDIGRPNDTLTIRFAKITYRVNLLKADGTPYFEINSWDLTTNSGG